jgi:hypothetical protein
MEIEPQPTASAGRVAAIHSQTARQVRARISVEPEGSLARTARAAGLAVWAAAGVSVVGQILLAIVLGAAGDSAPGQMVSAAVQVVAGIGSATARLRVQAPAPVEHSVDPALEVAVHAAACRVGLPALAGLEAAEEASGAVVAGEDAVKRRR